MAFIDNIKSKLFRGHERSIRAKKTILILSLLKGYSVFLSFLLVPLTLNILDEVQYGIWITVFNVLTWISILDIGIGNGLRNKFVHSMTRGDINEAREYVSTAYVIMAFISFLLIGLFIIPWLVIDWSIVFNVPFTFKKEIFYLIGVVVILTFFNFVLNLLGVILTALHKPALSVMLGAISNSLIFLFIYLLYEKLSKNLFAIGLIYTLIPLIVFIIATIIIFKFYYRNISPSFLYFKKDKVKSLISLGSQFFITQIAVVVIFSTDTFIISHVLSPKEVTSYNIVLRYFSIVSFCIGIFMTPLWSLYTEAVEKKDLNWIKSVLKKQISALVYIVLLLIIMLIFAKDLIRMWLHTDIEISWLLLYGMAIFTFISIWNNIFAFILNGMSVTKIQTITSIFAALVNIPLSIFFAKFYGNGGVIIASSFSLSIFAFFGSNKTFALLKKSGETSS